MILQIIIFSVKLLKDFLLYIFKFLGSRDVQYYHSRSKSAENMKRFKARTKVFQEYYFFQCTKEQFKISEDIRSIEYAKTFKKFNLDFIRPQKSSFYAMHDVSGDLKLLTRLRLNFCHFNKHNFKDANNAMCIRGFERETTNHYHNTNKFHKATECFDSIV